MESSKTLQSAKHPFIDNPIDPPMLYVVIFADSGPDFIGMLVGTSTHDMVFWDTFAYNCIGGFSERSDFAAERIISRRHYSELRTPDKRLIDLYPIWAEKVKQGNWQK